MALCLYVRKRDIEGFNTTTKQTTRSPPEAKPRLPKSCQHEYHSTSNISCSKFQAEIPKDHPLVVTNHMRLFGNE